MKLYVLALVNAESVSQLAQLRFALADTDRTDGITSRLTLVATVGLFRLYGWCCLNELDVMDAAEGELGAELSAAQSDKGASGCAW